MPTHEAVSNTIIPKTEEKPIPTRTVSTKPPKLKEANPVQPIKVDSQAPEVAQPVEESVKLSPQLSAIARKEQAFRQRELALKQREDAMQAGLSDAEKYRALVEKLKSKDFSEAEALGLDYEEYTKYKLEKANGEDPLLAKIKELEQKLEGFQKGNEESATQQYEETVSEYKREIASLVADHPDLTSIKSLKKEDAVLQLILDTFAEDGEELTVMEAAKLVEDQIVKMGEAFISLPKLKKEVPVEPEQKVLPRPVVGKTLTNNMTVDSEKRPLVSLQKLSEAERYAEARRRVLERQQKGK